MRAVEGFQPWESPKDTDGSGEAGTGHEQRVESDVFEEAESEADGDELAGLMGAGEVLARVAEGGEGGVGGAGEL